MVDHTLLKPEATAADVTALIDEARSLGVLAVCVSPSMLPIRAEGLVTAAVVGFPSGKHHSLVKGAEARLAVDQGAAEIDMVIDVGAAVAGDYSAVLADILTVREAMGESAILKVILETAALSDEAIVECCRAAVRAGANFVKTSTGFHPAGGATVEAVALMAQTVGPGVGVKASGGIRTTQAALDMIAAGATRLGLSGSRAVLGRSGRLGQQAAAVRNRRGVLVVRVGDGHGVSAALQRDLDSVVGDGQLRGLHVQRVGLQAVGECLDDAVDQIGRQTQSENLGADGLDVDHTVGDGGLDRELREPDRTDVERECCGARVGGDAGDEPRRRSVPARWRECLR